MLAAAGIIVSVGSLLAWIGLALFRHGFWRADQRLERPAAPPDALPQIVAVVPARNEAPLVGEAVVSLLRQDYAPALRVVLVDDGSEDGTAEAALSAARTCGCVERLHLVACPPRPAG